MILVIGGTGNVGRQVVAQLRERGADFRVLSRDWRRARELLGDVEVVEGDYDHPETLRPALKGVDHLFLLTPGSPEQVAREGAIVEAAQRAEVRHIVKQSVCGAALDSPSVLVRWHAEAERLVESSGLGWTFLRPTLFMQMAPLLRSPDGIIYSIVGDARHRVRRHARHRCRGRRGADKAGPRTTRVPTHRTGGAHLVPGR